MEFAVIVLLLVTALTTFAFDPYSLGSHQTIRLTVERENKTDLLQDLDIWSPVEAGTYPLFYLLDSFGAITPGDAYDDTMGHVASHGFVVVNAWRADTLNFAEKVVQFTATIEWSKTNLESYLYAGGASPDLAVNFSLTFGMGHSAGSHILVDFLKLGCSDFKGIVLSSPVDGINSLDSTIEDGTILNFEIPAIVLPAGLDNVAGLPVTFPCAPDEISNLHFYNALDPNSPRWLVNATEYGHGDYLDQFYVNLILSTHFCAFKANATLADFVLYRNFFSGQVVSFLKSLLEDDCETYLPFIEDFASMPVLATGTHVNPSVGCPRAHCNWTPI